MTKRVRDLKELVCERVQRKQAKARFVCEKVGLKSSYESSEEEFDYWSEFASAGKVVVGEDDGNNDTVNGKAVKPDGSLPVRSGKSGKGNQESEDTEFASAAKATKAPRSERTDGSLPRKVGKGSKRAVPAVFASE